MLYTMFGVAGVQLEVASPIDLALKLLDQLVGVPGVRSPALRSVRGGVHGRSGTSGCHLSLDKLSAVLDVLLGRVFERCNDCLYFFTARRRSCASWGHEGNEPWSWGCWVKGD